MNVESEDGGRWKLYESGAGRLAHVASSAPVGRLQTPKTWSVTDVRGFQERGLWNVDWLDPGDTEHIGAWVITGLTEKGRNLLAEWNRRVVQGDTARGPKRQTGKGNI